jgi:hypothetical protein
MLVVERALALMSRRARTGSGFGSDDEDNDDKSPSGDATKDETKPEHSLRPAEAKSAAAPAKPVDKSEDSTQPIDVASRETKQELPTIQPPDPKAEPWPDATPAPMRPVKPAEMDTEEETERRPKRSATETVGMPIGGLGRPPDMPRTTNPPPLALGDVEDPTHMPGPRDIPSGEPADPAPAPGRVPPGDSRSLRREAEFALIYRVGTYVITRFGTVGTRGQWRVVEYPTSSSASHSYAKECSRFVSEGFSDYRD